MFINHLYIFLEKFCLGLLLTFFKKKLNWFNWRLITLQYYIGFAIHQRESAIGVHVSRVPHPEPPPFSLPVPSFWVIPVHQPQASCILHQTWTGDLFLIWYYTCFNKRWRGSGEKGILLLCWSKCKLTQSLWRRVSSFSYTTLPFPSYIQSFTPDCTICPVNTLFLWTSSKSFWLYELWTALQAICTPIILGLPTVSSLLFCVYVSVPCTCGFLLLGLTP